MADEIVISWRQLDGLFAAMEEVGGQSDQIAAYFREHVCSDAGLTGALTPLGNAMPRIAGWFDDMDGVFDRRWEGVTDAVATSARGLDRADQSVSIDIDRLRGAGSSAGSGGASLEIDLGRLTAPEDVSGDLTPPERGEDQLEHDRAFEAVADAWDGGIHIIQQGVDFLRWLGFDLEDPPTPTLRELVIEPLSGDWNAIRANGDACTTCDAAMRTWGGNFTGLALDTSVVVRGDIGLRLATHLGLYALAVQAMGAGVNAGRVVFDEVADVSERIGREVEETIVWLGRKVGELLTKIGKRCVPVVGWALTAWDVLDKGAEAFTDIWDDAVACFETVKDLMDLVDEVRAWAETQSERLDTFQQVLAAADQLPLVGDGGLEALPGDVSGIEQSLRDITDFQLLDSEERDAIEERLGGIDERQEEAPTEGRYLDDEILDLIEDYASDQPLPGPPERLTS